MNRSYVNFLRHVYLLELFMVWESSIGKRATVLSGVSLPFLRAIWSVHELLGEAQA
jgi:hypothetical protein